MRSMFAEALVLAVLMAAPLSACSEAERQSGPADAAPPSASDAGIPEPTPDASLPNADAGLPDADAGLPDPDAGVPDSALVVYPASQSLTTGQTAQFEVLGAEAGLTVDWSVQPPNAGTITASGLYTAPSFAGVFEIIAASHSKPWRVGTATVTVSDPASDGGYLDPSPVSGDVTVTIDSHDQKPVSPYIYGINFKYNDPTIEPWPAGYIPPKTTPCRWGGNGWTPWNWEKGFSNSGNDWNFQNFGLWSLNGGTVLGGMIKGKIDAAIADNTATIVTCPIIGYQARDGVTTAAGPSPAPDRWTPTPPPLDRFIPMLPKNPVAPGHGVPHDHTVGSGASLYADDFAKWLRDNYGPGHGDHFTDPASRIFIALDNEPEFWGGDWYSAHTNIQGLVPNGPTAVTPHHVHVDKTIAFAAAIKDVIPDAVILGGVFAGPAGLNDLNNGSIDGTHPGHYIPEQFRTSDFPYLEWWLSSLNDASTARGARLVDVLDLHDYPETDVGTVNRDYDPQTDAVIDVRCQEPRRWWDPDYATPRANPPWLHGDQHFNWVNRLKALMARYPNGPQKIATSEYFYGRGGDISGAIAQADLFGIFGREGVYAATIWPFSPWSVYDNTLRTTYAGTAAALRAFLSYDGAGAAFGDKSIRTTINDPNRPPDPRGPAGQTMERVTTYSSTNTSNPNHMILVSINKTRAQALNVGYQVTHTTRFTKVERYQITGGNGASYGITGPTRLADVNVTGTNVFNATLPAQSISVFVLK